MDEQLNQVQSDAREGHLSHSLERELRPSWMSRTGILLAEWVPFGLWILLLSPMVQSGRFPGGDAPHILGVCMRLGWYFSSGQWDTFFDRFMSLLAPHPPGGYLLPTLFYAALGPVWSVPFLASTISLLFIWDAILRMMRATNARGAWGVALTLAAAPIFWKRIEFYGMDLPAATAVAQALSHLMVSRGFLTRRSAILAGGWIGIGFWVKFTFPIFLVLPCAVMLASLLWDRYRKRESVPVRLKNGGALLLAALGIASPLLLAQGREIVLYVLHSLQPTEEEVWLMGSLGAASHRSTSAFDRNMFYVAALKDIWGWPGLFLLFLGGALVVYSLWRSSSRSSPERNHAARATALALVCSLSGMFVLSMLSMKADRYALPMLAPLLAVLIPPLSGRRWLAPLVVIAMIPPLPYVVSDYRGWTHALSFDGNWREISPFVPASVPAPSFRELEHPAWQRLTTWGRYPLVDEPYRPTSHDPSEWRVNEALKDAAQYLKAPESWLGLLREEGVAGPGFGIYLMTAERMGLHWNFATVKILPEPNRHLGFRPVIFQGPFLLGETVRFTVLVALYENTTPYTQRYLEALDFEPSLALDRGQTLFRILVDRSIIKKDTYEPQLVLPSPGSLYAPP